jgi:hypothetical protein
MSKEKYQVTTSWTLPTGDSLVLAVTKSEAMFFYIVQKLNDLDLINDFELLTAELLIIRDGYQKVA